MSMTQAPRVRRKWRPTLALIVYAVLLAVLALPISILIWLRTIEQGTGYLTAAEIGALVIALAFTLGVGYVLTRSITGPIEALIGRTQEIAQGGKAALKPLERYGTREIATLSQSFLDLAGELVERTDYVRSFAAHVCYELKSPLTAIRVLPSFCWRMTQRRPCLKRTGDVSLRISSPMLRDSTGCSCG